MTADAPARRLALVVHPARDVGRALATLRGWADRAGVEVVQLAIAAGGQRLAPEGELQPGDLVVALGGDGTVLAALRASASTGAPVLGIACGSLGALTAVTADELDAALGRLQAGDWTARPLPALVIGVEGAADTFAVNDFVVMRRGAGQVAADVIADGELYVRLAGDGLVVATALGSSAYSMAAGGPILAAGTQAFVCTPLAMHGGSGPPLVVPADATLTVEVEPGYAGFDTEVDGRPHALEGRSFRIALQDARVTLVTFGPAGRGLTGLRRRGLVTDSPRILARDERAERG